MKLLYCSNCHEVFSLSAVRKKCSCKKTAGQVVDDTTIYSGEFAMALIMPDMFFHSDTYVDKEAVTKKSAIKSVNEDDKNFCIKVIEYLNDKAGTSFSTIYPSSASVAILQRREEHNCNLEDFIKVIDKKVKDWKGADFEIYLRPSTLFNKTKFENYLGQHEKRDNKTGFGKFRSVIQAAAENISAGSHKDAQSDSSLPGH